MKKVLVSGYIGFNNFGDELIFSILSSHLKSLDYKVSVLCGDKKNTSKNYDVESFYYKNFSEIFKAILNCNILISGGGSLLQNKTSNFSLYYYLFIIFLAKLFGKKVIIFAQGIEPIKGKLPTFLTRLVLKLANNITLRDENSQKLLNSWGIKSQLVSDPAYAINQTTKIYEEKSGLIVQLRSYFGIDKKFIENLAYSISRNYMGNIKVLSLQNDYDEKVCKEFILALKKYDIQAQYVPFENINKTIEIINQSEFIVSTRLHGLIVANVLKCKNFALSYDEKVKTLCDELNLPNVDIKNYTCDELDNKLDAFFNHHLNEVHPYRHFSWEYLDDSLKN